LASIAIEYLLSAGRSKLSCIAFIYCNYKKQDEQDAKGLLATLLRQLVEQCDFVPECVKTLYNSHRKTGFDVDTISHTLSTIVGSKDRVFLVVDALDECSTEARETFLTEIGQLQMKTKASFMATCRPIEDLERDLEERFREHAWLEIRATEEDVEKYIDSHLNNLLMKLSVPVGKKDALLKYMQKCIAEAADGM
jgi:hypothetical protein